MQLFLFLFVFVFVFHKRVFYLNILARHPISRFEKQVAISQKCIRTQIVHIVSTGSPML